MKQRCEYCDKDTRWVPVLACDWPKGWIECLGCGAKEQKQEEDYEY